uniref:phosphatidate cytidylyltransferase, mitochondrial n=1 Tax=Ictidomys tridecemlineatus TaxID=43179 RepID=UPI001A9E0363|nr:phosphatidate cytidylyltransferase, mitochondrial [Ictidomys tridecemlineatus]
MALQALHSSGVAFRKILSHFPEELSLAFAYGSGVYRQAGPNSDQKVSPAPETGPSPCGFPAVHPIARILLVLPSDPVKIIAMNENVILRSALDKNLKSAVTAAFLMLPESFSEEDLFIEIAGLSYSGDFRMVIGEDKTKVLNIVLPNMAHFRELYSSILQENPQVVYKTQQGRLEVNRRWEITSIAPKATKEYLVSGFKTVKITNICFRFSWCPVFFFLTGLSAIVRPSSIRQSTKGIFTAAGGSGLQSLQPRCPGGVDAASPEHLFASLSLLRMPHCTMEVEQQRVCNLALRLQKLENGEHLFKFCGFPYVVLWFLFMAVMGYDEVLSAMPGTGTCEPWRLAFTS